MKDVKISQLKDSLLDLAHIVKIQVQKSKHAVFNNDANIALEVLENNKRVEILNLQITQHSKDILNVFNPSETELRLVMSILKISNNLERIGFHSRNISRLLINMKNSFGTAILNEFKLNKMYDKAIKMLYDIQEALENNDIILAKETFKKDQSLNKINRKASSRAVKWLQNFPGDTEAVLEILDIINHLEVIGDYIKCISVRIMFYTEAKSIDNFLISASE